MRHNPRRAHLVVSRVLGKHVPVAPADAIAAGRLLGRLAVDLVTIDRVGGREDTVSAARGAGRTVVLGSAETATALGHLVADCFADVRYLHSTRRQVAGLEPIGSFQEVHSHAREHLLLPADPGWLANDDPVVIVDDELTTGRTAIATIRAVQEIHPRKRYVVATLLDFRTAADRAELAGAANDLGVDIDVVALVTAELTGPSDLLDQGQRLVARLGRADPEPEGPLAPVRRLDPGWPHGAPIGGRHGFDRADRPGFARAVSAAAEVLLATIADDASLLVLGTEELMYAPMMIAERVAALRTGPVRFSSTTRSPVLPVNADGYAIRTRLTFDGHDGPDAGDGTVRFAYNVAPYQPGERFDHIAVVVDEIADTAALWGDSGLVTALRRVCGAVSVMVLPADQPRTSQLLKNGGGQR